MNENQYEYIIDAFTRKENNTDLEVNNLNVSCITSLNNKFELDSNGNLTVKSIKADFITSETTLNMVYPIGSIYLSVNEKNPGSIFGGTWEQIKDKFLLSCGDTYLNGATGGEEKHQLTINEMPNHSHGFTSGTASIIANQLSNSSPCYWNANNQGLGTTQISSTGGSQAHNNMPPYIAVYMWKRIG